MEDFKGKIIKVYLASDSAYTCETGYFIKLEDNFLVIKNHRTGKIDYFCLYFVKSIQIVGEECEE